MPTGLTAAAPDLAPSASRAPGGLRPFRPMGVGLGGKATPHALVITMHGALRVPLSWDGRQRDLVLARQPGAWPLLVEAGSLADACCCASGARAGVYASGFSQRHI